MTMPDSKQREQAPPEQEKRFTDPDETMSTPISRDDMTVKDAADHTLSSKSDPTQGSSGEASMADPDMVVHYETSSEADQFIAADQEASSMDRNIHAGRFDTCFRGLSFLGPIVLLLLVCAHTWPEFLQAWQGKAVYCPGEISAIQIFQQTQADGQWLTPSAGSAVTWPGFSAWLGLLSLLLPVDFQSLLYPLGTVLSGLLAVWAVWGLAKMAGFGKQAAFASGLILLTSVPMIAVLHQTGPAGLAAALLISSQAFLSRGWQSRQSWFLLPVGFALAALAGLTGGLFHLMVPLVTSLLFLIWRCTYRRAQQSDALSGFVLLLLILGGWLGAAMLFGDAEKYLPSLGTMIFTIPALDISALFTPLFAALLALAPWLLVVFCVSWGRVLSSSVQTLKDSRKEKAGAAFVWLGAFTGLISIFLIPESQLPTAVTSLLCLSAPLLGKALLHLSRLGSRFFYLVIALLLLHLGMALTAAAFGPSLDFMSSLFGWSIKPEFRQILLASYAWPVIGVSCMILAVLLARFIRRDMSGGPLLVCALACVLLAQPSMLWLTPDLAAVPAAKLSSAQKSEPAVPIDNSQTSSSVPEDSASVTISGSGSEQEATSKVDPAAAVDTAKPEETLTQEKTAEPDTATESKNEVVSVPSPAENVEIGSTQEPASKVDPATAVDTAEPEEALIQEKTAEPDTVTESKNEMVSVPSSPENANDDTTKETVAEPLPIDRPVNTPLSEEKVETSDIPLSVKSSSDNAPQQTPPLQSGSDIKKEGSAP